MITAIRKVPYEDITTFIFLEEQFDAIYRLHTPYQDLGSSDVVFNDLMIYPFLRAVAGAVVRELYTAKTKFCAGEVYLESISNQLKALNMITDDRNQYKAVGLIKMYGYKSLEVVLLETPSHFGFIKQLKSKFNHHKGLFGTLPMLKTVADVCRFSSIVIFKKIKILFVHASNITIALWGVSLAGEGDIYDLWLEEPIEIAPSIDDKLEAVPILLENDESAKGHMRDGGCIKKELESILVEKKFKSRESVVSLQVPVNLSILRLIEALDKAGTAGLGPIYVTP